MMAKLYINIQLFVFIFIFNGLILKSSKVQRRVEKKCTLHFKVICVVFRKIKKFVFNMSQVINFQNVSDDHVRIVRSFHSIVSFH